MGSFVELIRYEKNREELKIKSEYSVNHGSNNGNGKKVRGGTNLEQFLTVTKEIDTGKVKCEITFDEFPRIDNEREAILKFAEWMHRLSVAIENHWGQ